MSQTTVKPGMFSTRTAPWFKLGELIDQPVTAAEAAKLAGIDWTVSPATVQYTHNGKQHSMESRQVIVRDDTGEAMGISSDSYGIVQYSEAFDFMDAVSPHFIAAGPLQGGKQAFMVVQLKLEKELNVLGGEDPHSLFGVLRTSHNCTRAIEIMAMPLRHRCMNQLTLRSFSKGIENRWSITHTRNAKEKLQNALASVQKLSDYVSEVNDLADRLVHTEVTNEKALAILDRVVPSYSKKREEVKERIVTMWHTDPTVGYSNTGWGLVNAVSSYYDWERSGGTAESRFVASLQGQTHTAINRTAGMLLTRR